MLTRSDGFRVELAPDRERVIVRVLGELDLATAAEVEGPLTELLDSGFGSVVLDLRGVTFIDSSGIHVLLRSHQHAERLGAQLWTIVGASRSREVLEITGAIDHLSVA